MDTIVNIQRTLINKFSNNEAFNVSMGQIK